MIEEDRLTNELRFAIEDRVVSTVATQQPIAADLRFCIARVTLLHEAGGC